MTLDAARGFLDAALATGHARQVLPATRLFLHCQAQIDRSLDPLVDERHLRNANARHKLLTEREQMRKRNIETEFEMQAVVRLLTAHPELVAELAKHIAAGCQEAATR